MLMLAFGSETKQSNKQSSFHVCDCGGHMAEAKLPVDQAAIEQVRSVACVPSVLTAELKTGL